MLQVRKLMESDWETLNVWWSQFGQSPWVDGDTFRDIMPGAFQVGRGTCSADSIRIGFPRWRILS